jgi:hypothetical protein
MRDAQQIADRVQMVRMRNTARDRDYSKIIAIRRGDYESVAPGLFNTAEFDKPLIANLIDTTARDIAEVMAPLPSVNCQSASLSSEADQKRQDLRGAIANCYVQNSRLQDQMFGGADRYGTFGFMAYIVEPDFKDSMPVIRVDDIPSAYYTHDYRGRVAEYFAVYSVTADILCHQFPGDDHALRARFKSKWGEEYQNQKVEVVRFYNHDHQTLSVLDPPVVLVDVENLTKRCPVRIVERPSIVPDSVRGQFDDVIWVQIARALVQVYTMNALEQSVNAPITVPQDATEIEIGPFTTIQTNTPGAVGRVNLNLSPGLFPEFQTLAQEQRMGSRYPEGRSGSIDASIITGQGVQALMGTFDTQVQTFQRLNTSALEDVVAMCFEMDERAFGGSKKTRYIKDNGAPRRFDYTPIKDINGDYTIDVSYGAIAGLDPNRGLVFVLQALAGGLIAKSTARKTLPVDLNVQAEERQIQKEAMDDSIAAAIAMLPQAIPQMAMGGADPRELVLQISQLRDLLDKGKSPSEAIAAVFAPKEPPAPEPSPLEQAQGAGPGPAGLPGAGGGGASDLLMSLAGMTPGGNANLQSNVSRMQPAQN